MISVGLEKSTGVLIDTGLIFKVTKIKAMKLFFLAKKGLHLTDPDVILKKSDKISLKTQQPIEIDGDFFDYGPAEISVKKHSIQLKI